ncbi:co-chaperone DjlA [Arsenophonus symbiont of Ornithomya chloropus]|uniref:co-chaperone DjlA n=1 Tax=Arsenophonus symbiont of Ornithomya chloropus TaxID=634121 RepID=UPI0032B2A9DC
MKYSGKIIGVMLGIIFGTHILGLIIGFLIGHAYDKVSEEEILDKLDPQENLQSLFFISTFQILGHLTKAKGRITELDIKLATHLMDKMQLYGNARILARNAFREGKEKTFPIRKILKRLRLACFGRLDLIQMFLEIQIQAAFSDGSLHPNERKMLFIISDELGISYQQFLEFLNMMERNQKFNDNYYNSNHHGKKMQKGIFENACKVLGVEVDDDLVKVKRAYRKLMSKHHPDKLIAKGLPKEMIERAKKKAQSIQSAYDFIKKVKNLK